MGGCGSGRRWHYGAKATVEDCRCLDIRRWQRSGVLRQGGGFCWPWARRSEVVSDVVVYTQPGYVTLSYQYYGRDGQSQNLHYPVDLMSTPCHFGGKRQWFRCPAQGCGRAAAKLYLRGRYFACRRCYGLAYQSQRENGYGRALLKAQRIRMRLGGSANMTLPFPPKPKGMHWRTYNRLWARGNAATQHSIEGLRIWLDARKRSR